MRTLLVTLVLAALYGCRSISSPDDGGTDIQKAERLVQVPAPQPPAPKLRGLRAYFQGDSVIVEAQLVPKSPLTDTWRLSGAFNEGDDRREVGFRIDLWTWPHPTSIHEAWDGAQVGWVSYWRDEHRFRVAAVLTDDRYSLAGDLTLRIPTTVFPTPADRTYRIPVRGHGPRNGRGLIAAE